MGERRTYVIGDIHGCLDELNRLLDIISPAGEDHVCFLGDYIDRGPAPMGVIERLIQLQGEGPQCTFLKGNHEDMFLSYLGYPGQYGDSFLANGGGRTLASYGIGGLFGVEAAKRLPPDHLEFLLALETEKRIGDFFCVHAGLRPGCPLESQSDEDRFWIREEFIQARHAFPFTIVFGHTPYDDVHLDLPYKIGLDTGVVYGNKLSCLVLETKSLIQVTRGGRTATTRDLTSGSRICSP